MTSTPLAHYRCGILASVSIAACFSVQAASPNVDAGSLLRQTEQELQTQKHNPALPAREAKPEPVTQPNEATVQVRSFKFVGNTLLSKEKLSTALASFIKRPVTVSQLKQAADVVTLTYREAGWIVHAFLPRQEIDGGVVTIQIVEAMFGGTSLQGAAPQRIDAARLIRLAEANLVKGQPLNANNIDRALLLLSDLPGVSVAGNLVEGQRDGETSLALIASDRALLNGNASIDNYGSRATGADRLSVNLNLNSPARIGDALAINALKTQGSDYERVSYGVPVGYNGMRAGVHGSNLNYRVITADFAALNPNGAVTTRGFDLSYRLLRSQLRNINFALSYDDKQFKNTSNSVTTSYDIKAYNASFSASQIDNWAGGGFSSASAGITTGDKNTEGRYNKLNINLGRLQSLTADRTLYVAATMQSASKNLDSSEKMYLGGASGVRAYPASEAGGSEGKALTVELRQRLLNNFTLTGFYDYGWVKVNHDNTVSSPANPNSFHLEGYGVSLAWQAAQSVDIKATLSQRIGSNPAAQANGTDSDGTKNATRIWLSANFAL
jgi:hemolysin activation/secretion protein